MKKTLTVLMALGGVVTGAETITLPETNGYATNDESKNTYYVVTTDKKEDGTYTNSFLYQVGLHYDNDYGDIAGALQGAVHIGYDEYNMLNAVKDDSGAIVGSTDTGVKIISVDEAADQHQGVFHVGDKGTLVFVGNDENTTTTGGVSVDTLLATTEGTGNLVLRTPDQNIASQILRGGHLTANVSSATKFTGNLLLSPSIISGTGTSDVLYQQSHVKLVLQDNADISSFNSVLFGSAETTIAVEGDITKNAAKSGHVNNLTLIGASKTFLQMNYENSSQEVVLGGVTTIEGYKYVGSGYVASMLDVDYLKDGNLKIEELSGKLPTPDENGVVWAGDNPRIAFNIGKGLSKDTVVTGNSVIESFNFEGNIDLIAYSDGKNNLTINLKNDASGEQKLLDTQIIGHDYAWEVGESDKLAVTLTGGGRYVLSDGQDIIRNTTNWTHISEEAQEEAGLPRMQYTHFATLSDDWTGTVEVNRLDLTKGTSATGGYYPNERYLDFSLYGNADSTVEFNGFKGYLYDGQNTDVTIQPDLVLYNAAAEGSAAAMNAFEITNGFGDSTQNYEGNISGSGDFVVNTSVGMNYAFTGDISGWTADEAESPALIVKQGTQNVSFSSAATVINADLSAEGGTMNATFNNAEAVTVNGAVSQTGSGKLNVDVTAGTTATFNASSTVNKLTSTGTTVVGNTDKITAGMIGVADRNAGTDATVSDGTIITGNTVTGGKVAGAQINLGDAHATLSGVEFANTTITGTKGQTVTLDRVSADTVFYNNVLLSGEGANYITSATEAFSGSVTDGLELTTGALDGMTLDSLSQATVKLQDVAEANLPTDGTTIGSLTITLTGFVMEGILTDTASSAFAATDTSGAKTYISEGAWRDDLVLSNNLLNNLDLSDAIVTYFQMYNADPTSGAGENVLFIKITNAVYTIPEPTTATLSLLALAGLAARRRRR